MSLRIDRYGVKRLLGQGAMGKVFLAVDPKLNREVAIKVLTASAEDQGLRRRFCLEARAIAALKHPNIVEIYDFSGENAPDAFLVMEYVPGPSLYQLTNARGHLSEQTTLCVAHEVALALEHAHNQQLVHRDIKPENILLHQGRVVLTDFGVAKALAPSSRLGILSVQTRTVVLGTPGFMAPEQFGGRGIGPQTDIFALGAVMYNLATGQLAFDGNSLDEICTSIKRGRYVDPRQHNPFLSAQFCKLVADCLAARPKDRLPSALVLRQRVVDILSVHGVTEIRQELMSFQKNPGGHDQEQRERNLNVLVRDLKVALKDRDEARARDIVDRIQLLGPAADHMQDISGVYFDSGHRLIVDTQHRRSRESIWLLAGILLGGAIASLGTSWLIVHHRMPSVWLQLVQRLGIGH